MKNSEPVTNQRDEVEIKLTRTGLLVARGILLSSNTLCPLSSHPNLTLTSEDSMKSFTPLSILKRKKKAFSVFPHGEKHKVVFCTFQHMHVIAAAAERTRSATLQRGLITNSHCAPLAALKASTEVVQSYLLLFVSKILFIFL